ncbi:helix-turn-helix transcriptional regulator [Pseudomonas sp. No.21]|jgi:ATP/maltotriose-dependent transcriptional regulator MalT|uniref:LuxR C-terminal-related transcriptional regulator n=1 Tax=Pseudomonas tohonis TaxID=2725477 RepID=UPI001F17FEA6|nr:LuxR C-terminal-related transcriptional regulator [Pseudomonas tohonis]GJN47131.1 helix-turn-helix transcriptional regulator [Pseudomonas tohonis]
MSAMTRFDSHAYLPRLPALHVPRPRLCDALVASSARLRLLCAPAGSGKSVLLMECVQRCPADHSVHWLPLGGVALSPAGLCAGLAAVMGLEESEETCVQRALAQWTTPGWIILDDYCRQPNPELDACLDRLLTTSSPALRWWISGRRRPACNLPRLLIDGELLELDAAALALNAEELARLLEPSRHGWPNDAPARLLESTGGWCAGVRMALLEPVDWGFADPLQRGGHSATLAAYLDHELFAGLGPEQAEAWLALAHLPRFNAALCEHLFGPGDGARLLRDLDALGSFIEPLGDAPGWFRIFAPLALQMRNRDAHSGRGWHLRACQWFAAEGDWQAAAEHALEAEQPEAAVSLLQHFGVQHLFQGRNVALLLRLHQEVEESLLLVSPHSLRLLAGALLFSGKLDEAARCIAEQGRFLPQPDAERQRELVAYWQAQYGLLAHLQGDGPGARLHLAEALATLGDDAWEQKLICYSGLTQQALLAGDLDVAQELSREALQLARSHGSLLLEAFLELDHSQLLEHRGALLRADAVLERAQEFLMGQGRNASPLLGRLALRRGRLALRQGRDEEARKHYQYGLQEARNCGDYRALFGYLGLATLDANRREFDRAFDRLREAERLMQMRHIPERVYRAVLLQVSSSLLLMQGRAGQARHALLRVLRHFRGENAVQAPPATLDLIPRIEWQLALAELYEGEAFNARQRLLGQLHKARENGMHALEVEIHLALAEAEYLGGDLAQAAATLRDGLTLAEQFNLQQPLRELQLRQPAMLKALDMDPGEEPDDSLAGGPLSQRELEVLGLIAQGSSNQEIAERLFISLHTVKTHARRINGKLGVKRRTQAVAHAKALGLM